MTEDLIIDCIRDWIKGNALGKENAKPRRLLRNYVTYGLFVKMGDRTLRRIYASFNHVGYSCSNPKGIYWIDDARELKGFKDSQDSKAVAIFARTKKTVIAVEGERQPSLFP